MSEPCARGRILEADRVCRNEGWEKPSTPLPSLRLQAVISSYQQSSMEVGLISVQSNLKAIARLPEYWPRLNISRSKRFVSTAVLIWFIAVLRLGAGDYGHVRSHAVNKRLSLVEDSL